MSSDDEQIVLERSDFHLRLATSRTRRNSSVLIKRMYAWRGYHACAESSRIADEITLQACRKDRVFGTLTLRLDSGGGLTADALYKAEIDAYRTGAARVCELTRLAVDPRHASKHVLGALFHLAYLYGGVLHGATDVFIEVNPRHVSFYRRMLHFNLAGDCRMCERVQAPAVLMHLHVAHAAEEIARNGGGRGSSRSSLYPYFFSHEEGKGVARRILPATMGPRLTSRAGLLSIEFAEIDEEAAAIPKCV